MSHPIDESRWKTGAMIRAEIDLDEAAMQVDEDLARADEMSFDNPPLSDEEVDDFERAVRDPNAPEQLKKLAQRVDAGEFSWREIADGKAMRDPDVRAAFAEAGRHIDTTEFQQGIEMLKQGMSPDEVVTALRGEPAAPEPEPEAAEAAEPEPRRKRPSEEVDDDEYFSGSFLERGW